MAERYLGANGDCSPDNTRDNRYLVVKDGEDGAYGVRTLFDDETWSVEIDALDGSKVTCIKDRNKNTVDTAGEAVEEFDSIKDARLCAGRMSKIREVMEG